ncbi:hypothetical protein CPB84DRAFT_1537788 [Gymnopilus junonius]|uniref:Uncharacterized protein n=1 Tax=Gymnopilus junonius TaxID=109634 RepID=A0A9P5NHH6_GYMJU|nr:hypothetical protein CPB84DRAFT_1537788 [Gymnopilus junonius]
MTSNLSLLVDNLVSAKMMAVMDSMVKARAAAKAPPSTSPDQPDQVTSPTERESSPAESHGSVLISTLLDELKAMKEETRLRVQREKEEMEAIRQLHSAEVDALRRRLSYLESQNRYFESGVKLRERSASLHGGSNGHTIHTPTRTRSPAPMEGVAPTPGASIAGGARGENGAKTNPTPTPTSERTYSFSRERGEDDLPLPIKSQRKHHISFPRPHFG